MPSSRLLAMYRAAYSCRKELSAISIGISIHLQSVLSTMMVYK